MTAVVDRPVEPIVEAPRPSVLRRMATARLGAHVIAFVIVLAALAPFVRVGVAWTTDEGAYALEQRSLAHGSYAFDWRGRAADPSLRWYPIVNGTTGSNGSFAYVTHPAYPRLQREMARAVGETAGTLVLPLLGALGTAVAAWLLAGLVDDRARPVAFWLAALSPVLLNAWVIWAHAPSAALAGFALYAAMRAVRRRGARPWTWAWVGMASVMTVTGSLLRSENELFALGVAVAMVTVGWRERSRRAVAAVGAAAVVATAAVTAVLEARWRAGIVGVPAGVAGVRQVSGSLLGGRLSGAWHSVLSAGYGNAALDGLLLGCVLVAGVAAAAVATGRARAVRPLAVASVLVVAGYALHVGLAAVNPVTGLVPAVPALVVGVAVVLATLARRRDRVVVALAVAVAVAGAAVVATQYAEGGGLEWGGRFFSPVLAPLAALGAVGVLRLVAAVPEGRARRAATAAVIALVAAPALTSVVVLRQLRHDVAAVGHDVVRPGVTVVVTDSHALPRNEWRSHDRITWYRVPPGEVGEALDALRAAGAANVEVVESRGVEPVVRAHAVSVTRLDAPTVDRTGWSVLAVALR